MNDLSGKPPSDQDVQEALAVVQVVGVLKLPPDMAVQMPNVFRCLKHYSKMRSEVIRDLWDL